MVNRLAIQDDLERHIQPISELALSRSDSLGPTGRPNVAYQYWIAYEGGSYQDPADPGVGEGFIQESTLNFASYVQVRDLQRDYRDALSIHESLMQRINGYFPRVEGVVRPFTLSDDAPISVPSTNGPTYRYRAKYKLAVQESSIEDLGDLPIIRSIRLGIFRSPISQVGEPPPTSTKDLDLTVDFVED